MIFSKAMSQDSEKAQLMFKLIRKNNWGAKYDRLEHFKRFPDLSESVKELSNLRWIIIHKKPKFNGISLNTEFKSQIKEFVEKYMPSLKGINWIN